MATSTYYASDGGQIRSENGTYANVAPAYLSQSDTTYTIGQHIGYSVNQNFLQFDLAATPASGDVVPEGATINSVTFSVYTADQDNASTWTIRVCAYDWPAGVGLDGTEDWRSYSQLVTLYDSGDGQFASVSATSAWPTWIGPEAWVDFTEGSHAAADVAAAIGGDLNLVVFPDRWMTQNAPSASERVMYASDNNATSTYRPKLVIDYSVPVVPTVTTTAVTDITDTTATSGGTVTDEGSATVTAYGVCWNTTGSPTTADDHTHDEP